MSAGSCGASAMPTLGRSLTPALPSATEKISRSEMGWLAWFGLGLGLGFGSGLALGLGSGLAHT